jgi:signal transduction histidine kinase
VVTMLDLILLAATILFFLLEAHGGQISAQSQVGLGATIIFTLPMAYEGFGHSATAQAD